MHTHEESVFTVVSPPDVGFYKLEIYAARWTIIHIILNQFFEKTFFKGSVEPAYNGLREV